VTYRQVLDWISDLLTAYTHHSELHVITALVLISTLYKSLGHAKSSQSSLVVSWQRIYISLTVTAVHYEVFFAQPNSLLAISPQSPSAADSLNSNSSQSKSQDFLYDWRFTANQFVIEPSPLRPTTSIYFSLTEHLRL
jgi:hypothetical protein